MKIVRVIARLNVGGPAKHVAWLTAGLRGPDCDSILVAGTVPPGEEDMGYFATEQGLEPVMIAEMSREISFKDALTIWKLYRLFVRESPDIVHTHTAKAGTVGRVAGLFYRWLTPAALLGRPRKCHFIHTYHGHIFHSYYGPLKTRLFITIEKALARLVTDNLVVVSEQQRREISETFRVGRASQFVVIPLGLDLTLFADWEARRPLFRAELGAEDDEILVGIVGRLTEIKNHEFFLRAVAKYKERYGPEGSRVRFVIVGDGQLRKKLESQAESLGLAADVIFAGSRRDPENFYPALDIVALTSLNEGTPLTLIEAMANHRAVIATAVGGVVDLLGEAITQTYSRRERYIICKRGLSVPVNDTKAFAAGLNRLVQDAELRKVLGERGASFVTSNYSKDRLLNDVKALYTHVMKRENQSLSDHVSDKENALPFHSSPR
ncbi:MAG TPA: glycosyltransferase [Pyrinomonadaceae bacterium]|nr:glycosyltransferase [Pyrinomonadaceae bacterium]